MRCSPLNRALGKQEGRVNSPFLSLKQYAWIERNCTNPVQPNLQLQHF
ncbi:hypothetical protein VCHA41O246_50288 [Vibrio chagasii]|nr:hypothetical protein VCHA41O246_50288 [Vibrio chagasii]